MRLAIPSRLPVTLVALLTLFYAFPSAAFAESPVKVKRFSGEVDFATGGTPKFALTGLASHLGQFTAYGEVEFMPGEVAGTVVGEGKVVFEAANGDLLVGIMTWELDEELGLGQIHFSWRDFVVFSDNTIVRNTGRFVDDRPPGALIAFEFIFVFTLLLLG